MKPITIKNRRNCHAASAWIRKILLVLSVTLCWQISLNVFGQGTSLIVRDKVHQYVGVLEGPTVFAGPPGGHSGKLGDYAIDFGTSGAGTSVLVTNAKFLNMATTNDIMSFSVWIKRYDIVNSSVFWANSPSSGSDTRGFQAHVPWSNDNIYFDTAGCCSAAAQRISANISTFPGYSGDDSWWTNWHHCVCIKNGASDKEIWIDGQLFLQGSSSDPLPTDFTSLNLGSDGTGIANNMHGLIDDFAVFSTALSSNSIYRLSTGASPTNLTGETLIAYWPFDDPPVIMPPVGSFEGFTIVVNDVGSSVMATNTIKLSLNSNSVTPTLVTKVVSTTTIEYLLPNPPFPPGSTQYTSLTIKDTNGNTFTSSSFFVAPQLLLPSSLALPSGSVATNKPGFMIRTFQADNPLTGNGIQVAEDILAGNYGTNVANLADAGGVNSKGYFTWTNVINFDIDAAATNGSFNAPAYPDFNFPGIPGNPLTVSPTEHFACELYTALSFPTAGLYTMAVNSDDDFRTVTGPNPLDSFAALKLGEFNNPNGRASADTVFKFYVQKAGIYGFRTVYEQGTGGASLEWFMINADGTRVLINDITNSIKAYQWFPSITAAYVKSVLPLPDATNAAPNLVQAVIVAGTNTLVPSKVSLSLDGTAVPAVVTAAGSQLTVNYVPSPLFAGLSSHRATLVFADGSNQVTQSWKFAVEPYTLDKLHQYVGAIQGAAVFTPDKAGYSGKSGDHAIDLGSGLGNVFVQNAGVFLNIAATNDEMTFSIWVKKYDIANSSVFWAIAPSAGGGRGWQAHTPWSDDHVYFDTSGCCGAGQRLSGSITTFPGYTGTDAWWTNWHHFVFWKQTTMKQVWIDGQAFLSGDGYDPLPTDFTDLYVGSDGGGARMHGLIDDFAVYATALGTNEITALAGGAAPDSLAATNNILAYWSFNDAPSTGNAPTIKIGIVGGKVTITYTGTLASSATVNGTYTDVTGATSPYTVPTGPRQTFFRTHQ